MSVLQGQSDSAAGMVLLGWCCMMVLQGQRDYPTGMVLHDSAAGIEQ